MSSERGAIPSGSIPSKGSNLVDVAPARPRFTPGNLLDVIAHSSPVPLSYAAKNNPCRPVPGSPDRGLRVPYVHCARCMVHTPLGRRSKGVDMTATEVEGGRGKGSLDAGAGVALSDESCEAPVTVVPRAWR